MSEPFIVTLGPGEGPDTVWLKFWSIRELDGGERHLIGICQQFRESRISTAIVQIDVDSRTVITASGRRYMLVGPTARHGDTEHFWLQIVKSLGNNRTWTDVTTSVLPGSDAWTEERVHAR